MTDAPDDDLTFAVHDLGRERVPQPAPADVGFTPARPAPSPPAAATSAPPAPPVPPPAAGDGFVIREADGAAPAAPVDALVVGAPEPVAAAEPAATAVDQRSAFRINSATPAPATSSADLWTTRNPVPEPAVEVPAGAPRRGWSMRHSEVVDRSAHATMLRLREEAVNVSWKSAWIAVTASNPRLLRKRSQ